LNVLRDFISNNFNRHTYWRCTRVSGLSRGLARMTGRVRISLDPSCYPCHPRLRHPRLSAAHYLERSLSFRQ
jgi:hypothetical protein